MGIHDTWVCLLATSGGTSYTTRKGRNQDDKSQTQHLLLLLVLLGQLAPSQLAPGPVVTGSAFPPQALLGDLLQGLQDGVLYNLLAGILKLHLLWLSPRLLT